MGINQANNSPTTTLHSQPSQRQHTNKEQTTDSTTTMAYVHKKFDTIKSVTEEYTHKKFGQRMEKRKRAIADVVEDALPITVINGSVEPSMEQPLPKRRQTKALFRPWLNGDDVKSSLAPAAATPKSMPSRRSIKKMPMKEQMIRECSTVASTVRHTRRPEQALAEQQLTQLWTQNTQYMAEQYRATLYLRHLMYLRTVCQAQQQTPTHQQPMPAQRQQPPLPMTQRYVYQFGRV